MSYIRSDAMLTDLLSVPVNVPFGCDGSIYRVTNYNNLQVPSSEACGCWLEGSTSC